MPNILNTIASAALANALRERKKTPQEKTENLPQIMYEPKSPATIGELKIDVIIDREIKFESDVTENPVEDGFVISDHVNRKPITLTMTALFTPTPVTWFDIMGGNNQNRMTDVVNALQNIYKKGEPVEVKTVDAIYKDMMLISAPLPRNVENGYCYSAQLNFVQVRRAKRKTEKIPAQNTSTEAKGKAGATQTDAGQASTEEIGTGITTVDNKAVISVNTANISKGQTGDITTGKENMGNAVAKAVWECLAVQGASVVINKIFGK